MSRSWSVAATRSLRSAARTSRRATLSPRSSRAFSANASSETTANHRPASSSYLAEGERVGLEARRESELEQVLARTRRVDERVEPVAAHLHGGGGLAVHEHVNVPGSAQHEVDVPRLVAQAQARVPASDDPLRLDAPAAGVGELG